ncbi:hypothetical protein Goarm_022234 [Gossypium armourianum]|uniref:Uncharacterized protein n=1 Tax=Gossypium armourianum TaxID=34283 RepID=A0A7J9KHS6_9ROSI|nr:hypothetical protein [Gossypium armourianum]
MDLLLEIVLTNLRKTSG